MMSSIDQSEMEMARVHQALPAYTVMNAVDATTAAADGEDRHASPSSSRNRSVNEHRPSISWTAGDIINTLNDATTATATAVAADGDDRHPSSLRSVNEHRPSILLSVNAHRPSSSRSVNPSSSRSVNAHRPSSSRSVNPSSSRSWNPSSWRSVNRSSSSRSVNEHCHLYRQSSTVSGIFITDLPSNLRNIVDEIGLELDLDGDGRLDTNEIKIVVGHLVAKTKRHAVLKKIVGLLCAFAVFLTATLFATSIGAARLAMDTTVDAETGIMYSNTGGAGAEHSSVMKVDGAEFRRNIGIADMTNAQLNILKAILPGTSDVKFQVKGYARGSVDDENNNQVKLLVEGGTITYDSQGIIKEASGNAEKLLTFAYGDAFTTGFLARKSTVILHGDQFDDTPGGPEL